MHEHSHIMSMAMTFSVIVAFGRKRLMIAVARNSDANVATHPMIAIAITLDMFVPVISLYGRNSVRTGSIPS